GSGMNGLNRLAAELFACLFRALSELNERLPQRVAVFVFVGLAWKGDPLFPLLFVPSAVSQHEADAREFEVHEAAQRVLFIGAEFDAADHSVGPGRHARSNSRSDTSAPRKTIVVVGETCRSMTSRRPSGGGARRARNAVKAKMLMQLLAAVC